MAAHAGQFLPKVAREKAGAATGERGVLQHLLQSLLVALLADFESLGQGLEQMIAYRSLQQAESQARPGNLQLDFAPLFEMVQGGDDPLTRFLGRIHRLLHVEDKPCLQALGPLEEPAQDRKSVVEGMEEAP